jgi:hypothetical protein
MKNLRWIGLAVLVLGLALLVIPIPQRERGGFRAGDVSIGIETKTSEKVSPIVVGVMILAGAGLMIAGRGK